MIEEEASVEAAVLEESPVTTADVDLSDVQKHQEQIQNQNQNEKQQRKLQGSADGDQEEPTVEKQSELERIRERIIKVRLKANGNEEEAEHELHKRFGIDIRSHRGEWIEVHDEATCTTLYFCKSDNRIESRRPPGWVRMQIEGITKAAIVAKKWKRKSQSRPRQRQQRQHSRDKTVELVYEGGSFFQAPPK